MQTNDQSCQNETSPKNKMSDRWAEIMLAIACLLTLAWIGFTLWLAAEVLGLL